MRRIFAPALMVSALALLPASALADDSASQNAQPSSESTVEQNTDQTMTEDKAMDSEETSKDEMEPLETTGETAGASSDFISAQTPNQTLSEEYIGASVLIDSGEEMESVGTISQLIFDDRNAISAAVVDVGGFLGLGAKPVGLQWSALEEKRAEQTVAFTTSLTREDFENAPEFKDLDEQQREQQAMQPVTEEEEKQPGATGASD